MMARAAVIFVLVAAALGGCGVAGDPVPPEGAVREVAVEGIDLAEDKGGI